MGYAADFPLNVTGDRGPGLDKSYLCCGVGVVLAGLRTVEAEPILPR